MFGDEQRLERAFLNVLSNATRYAKTTIKIICEGKEENIVISIIDDGNGISNKDLPHICHKLDTVLRIFFPNVLFIINTDGKLRQNS
ncbi:ATP-binding protein [Tissierella praeacuta]|uniref:ATP-binding protein n=1 Tax=Tissierella praeacuta TaxID=43131 RepID=UPI0009FFC3CD|nr:ATP-binding protein [Tissierella praeacuta]